MTWEESDRLTWDERQVLLTMVDRRLAATPPPAGHPPAAERLARRVGG